MMAINSILLAPSLREDWDHILAPRPSRPISILSIEVLIENSTAPRAGTQSNVPSSFERAVETAIQYQRTVRSSQVNLPSIVQIFGRDFMAGFDQHTLPPLRNHPEQGSDANPREGPILARFQPAEQNFNRNTRARRVEQVNSEDLEIHRMVVDPGVAENAFRHIKPELRDISPQPSPASEEPIWNRDFKILHLIGPRPANLLNIPRSGKRRFLCNQERRRWYRNRYKGAHDPTVSSAATGCYHISKPYAAYYGSEAELPDPGQEKPQYVTDIVTCRPRKRRMMDDCGAKNAPQRLSRYYEERRQALKDTCDSEVSDADAPHPERPCRAGYMRTFSGKLRKKGLGDYDDKIARKRKAAQWVAFCDKQMEDRPFCQGYQDGDSEFEYSEWEDKKRLRTIESRMQKRAAEEDHKEH